MSDKSIGRSVDAWRAACQPREVVEGASHVPSEYHDLAREIADLLEVKQAQYVVVDVRRTGGE